MNIKEKDFYYRSLDLFSKKFPTKARFIKRLVPISGDIERDCAIIELEKKPEFFSSKYLVIAPRNKEDSIFKDNGDNQISLYVFDGEEYLDKEEIEFHNKKDFKDIGLITLYKDEALI